MAAPAASPRLCASTRPRLRPATGTAMQKSRAHHIRHSLGPDCSITRIVPMIVPAPLALYSTGACAALCVYVYCTYTRYRRSQRLVSFACVGAALFSLPGRWSMAWRGRASSHARRSSNAILLCYRVISRLTILADSAHTRACDTALSLLSRSFLPRRARRRGPLEATPSDPHQSQSITVVIIALPRGVSKLFDGGLLRGNGSPQPLLLDRLLRIDPHHLLDR